MFETGINPSDLSITDKMDPFDFQAPQFYERLDLKANNTNDGADEFFDANMEVQPENIGEHTEEVLKEKENRPVLKAKRRSWGVKPQTDALRERLKKDKLTFDGIPLNAKTPEKKHTMLTRNDVNVKTPKIELRSRSIRRETLKRCAESPLLRSGKQYMPFSESVYHFEHDTPPRFKTKPRNFVPTSKLVFPLPQSAKEKAQKPEQSECFVFKAKPSMRTPRDRQSISKKQIKLQPFSFDERDRQRKIEKENKIQQVIMEEAKKPAFHARPPPSFISNTTRTTNNTMRDSTPFSFKASEPTVLSKEPFIPKRILKPLTEPIELRLKTERRAIEREYFDNYLKEKDARNEELKKENEEIKKLIEQKEIAHLRNELVHKPKPLPKFYKS